LLKQTIDGRLLRLTLARPEKRNALHSELVRALLAAFESSAANRNIGAILLDAEGTTFCAGMDLEEAPTVDPATLVQLQSNLFEIGRTLTKPIIAAVQGSAYGGGVALVANAHIVLASDTARFGLTELRVGMWPFLAWSPIAAAIGDRRTRELALTTRLFTAVEALQWGLVHYVLPESDLNNRALDIAITLSESSAETMSRGLEAATHPERALALRIEQSVSADFQEGVEAFRTKRPPKWPSNQ